MSKSKLIQGGWTHCGRCKKQQDRCTSLTLSTRYNTSVLWLCDDCIKLARKTWNDFLRSGVTSSPADSRQA